MDHGQPFWSNFLKKLAPFWLFKAGIASLWCLSDSFLFIYLFIYFLHFLYLTCLLLFFSVGPIIEPSWGNSTTRILIHLFRCYEMGIYDNVKD